MSVMDRKPGIYREAATLLVNDLNRAAPIPGGWSIDVSDALVVVFSMAARSEPVAISSEVWDPDWFDVGDSPEERHEMAVAEATETLGSELLEVFEVWGLDVLRCSADGAPLDICTGVWGCRDSSHAVGVVGELSAGAIAATPWMLAPAANPTD